MPLNQGCLTFVLLAAYYLRRVRSVSQNVKIFESPDQQQAGQKELENRQFYQAAIQKYDESLTKKSNLPDLCIYVMRLGRNVLWIKRRTH